MPSESPTSSKSAIGSSVRAIAALYAVNATIGSPPLRRASSAGVRFLLSGATTLMPRNSTVESRDYTAVQQIWAAVVSGRLAAAMPGLSLGVKRLKSTAVFAGAFNGLSGRGGRRHWQSRSRNTERSQRAQLPGGQGPRGRIDALDRRRGFVRREQGAQGREPRRLRLCRRRHRAVLARRQGFGCSCAARRQGGL